MAGAGYKLFTTGQVLTAAEVNTYLQEQTVMVFNDAASRTTALSGVLAEGMVSYLKSTKVVEIYNGTAWASLDDPNAIQNTIVDAKGDLIAATGNDVPARLAVGNNGETLVADSSQTTGLRYNPPVASLANPVINGGFDIWQRGTSVAIGSGSFYSADRWASNRGGNVTGTTISRQTVSDSTNLPNIQYAARFQRDSGNTSTQGMFFYQSFETTNSIPFAGKTVTVSFYARAGANYSSASNNLTMSCRSGTGTDQNYASGFTNLATVVSQGSTLTTTWQRFAYTGTIAATATQLAIEFGWTPVGTAGANDWCEITGVQIDVGTWTSSTAPTFRRSGGTLAGELAACQRYYWRSTATGSDNIMSVTSSAYNTSGVVLVTPHPVPMRVRATSIDYANLNLTDWGTNYAVTSATADANATPFLGVSVINVAGTPLTAFRPYALRTSSSTGYIGFSAEL